MPVIPEYDLRVDWNRRFAREWPFFERLFRERGVKSILDCACGTGRHAVLFAEKGFRVAGSDIDTAMVRASRALARSRGFDIPFRAAAFDRLPRTFPIGFFDAVVCVGNSLSQLESRTAFRRALGSIAAMIRPGGIAVLHLLNSAALRRGEMAPQPLRTAERGGRKYFFQKIFFRRGNGVEVVHLTIREKKRGFESEVYLGKLLAIPPGDFLGAARAAGLGCRKVFGDYAGAPFVAKTSRDLILVAVRTQIIHGNGNFHE